MVPDMATADEAEATAAQVADPAAATTAEGDRPEGIPEKFWDGDAGALRTEALLKSYLELERKLGQMVALPADDADQEGRRRLEKALGVPDGPDAYEIQTPDELLTSDPEINTMLHEAGFTGAQAQLVYDLAASHMLPLVDQAIGDLESSRDVERLESHFGGSDVWRATAQQIKTWGQANLDPDTFATLSASHDGVLAMHQMLQAREPQVLPDGDRPGELTNEDSLTQMMRDPRYWKDRDPAFVGQVTAGFQRLYKGD
jgi:hypothetical protein